MRKKTLDNILDSLFWFIVYTLPIILFVVGLVRVKDMQLNSFSDVFSSFQSFMTSFVGSDSLIYTTLNKVCNEYLNVAFAPAIVAFLTYFSYAMIVHILIDVLLFIVRFAHKYLDKAVS